MNIILYMILGWLFGEFIHITCWEYIKKKFDLDEKRLKGIFIFIIIAIILAVGGSGFYRVQSFENTIVTTWNGDKIIKDTHGIKYSFLSNRVSVDLRKQSMIIPHAVGFYETVISKDNHPLRVSGSLEYHVVDVKKWAIENKGVEDRLYAYLQSVVMGVVQNINYDEINNRELIEEKVKEGLGTAEELYGIEILDFKMVYLTDDVAVLKAKTEAKSQRIKSEAEKKANDLLKDSLDDFSSEQLDYLKTRMLSESGSVKWVISEGGQVIVDSSENDRK